MDFVVGLFCNQCQHNPVLISIHMFIEMARFIPSMKKTIVTYVADLFIKHVNLSS